MKDFKKNVYRTATISDLCPNCTETSVLIGTQRWKTCNANVTTYRDGTPIPEVTDPSTWAALTTGAWCWYNNDPANGPIYGKLYNWYAINDTVHGGLAPVSCHLPTDEEWTVLTNYLGGLTIAGGKMKEVGLCHWNTPNTDATNTSLFTGLPGGARNSIGNCIGIGDYGHWWSSTEKDTNFAWLRYLNNNSGGADKNYNLKKNGLSVRFIEDCQCVAGEVSIGTQIWSCQNLNVSTYRNGEVIPQVTDPAVWQALTTGAWRYYNNDPANGAIYGKLYNWYAVNDSRGLAPVGWHVPTSPEWSSLQGELGGASVAGGKMKQVGTTLWNAPNTDATNSSCFTGLPGGWVNFVGGFYQIGNQGRWWSSTQDGVDLGAARILNYDSGIFYSNSDYIGNGLSVRLVKNY